MGSCSYSISGPDSFLTTYKISCHLCYVRLKLKNRNNNIISSRHIGS